MEGRRATYRGEIRTGNKTNQLTPASEAWNPSPQQPPIQPFGHTPPPPQISAAALWWPVFHRHTNGSATEMITAGAQEIPSNID
mmetsp:Transcript_15244/g.36273  ORF Transcript_15244/g.36273 Transcript_15244/m.36273 type:complete len:84 (-) Transcript_15244:17-268(-)